MDDPRLPILFVPVVLIVTLAAFPASSESLNISQFVFHDLNRNGAYDRGEPAYPGIPIRLEQIGREPIRRETNLAGFANFTMSDDDADQDITAAGPVSFHLELPEGLELTTEHAAHHGTVHPMARAPGGFVLDPPNPFIGVAPGLTITTSAAGLTSMSCGQDGALQPAQTIGTTLSCPVTPGDWRVVWDKADGTRVERGVTVTDQPLHIPATPADAPATGEPLLVTFDDFLTSQNIVELPSFDGFTFHNFVVAHRYFYDGMGYVNGTVSGEYSAYNSSGHPATITASRPFELRSLSVAVAWPAGMAGPVQITALRDGKVVAREAIAASNIHPIRFEPRWSNIDTVIIRHQDYWQFVLDDLVLVPQAADAEP